MHFLKTIQHPLAETSTDEIDLFALIQSLWQQKKLIAGTTLAVGAMALTYAMLAPRVYQASTVLRPAADAAWSRANYRDWKLPSPLSYLIMDKSSAFKHTLGQLQQLDARGKVSIHLSHEEG